MIQILGKPPDHDFDQPLGLLSDCHRRIEQFLRLLSRVAREFLGKPLTVEAADAIRTAQRYFVHAAPKHTADEEESLFPRMRDAAEAAGRSCEALTRLESDHDGANALHAKVDALITTWLSAGELGPPHDRELIELLDQLQALYDGHIRLEDQEVFPLAAELLSDEELAAVGKEMRSRRGVFNSGG